MDYHRPYLDSNPIVVARPSCLLANDVAEEVKQTTIAFRRIVRGIRLEAVYSADEALDLASKEDWRLILVAEHLAGQDLGEVLTQLRSRSPFSSIVVLGEKDEPGDSLMLAGSSADYYCTPRFGHASSVLPVLAMHLVEKRVLRRQIELGELQDTLTGDLLANLTMLLRQVTYYYETERQALGAHDDLDSSVPRKIAALEEKVTELIAWLAMKRQQGQRAVMTAREYTADLRG